MTTATIRERIIANLAAWLPICRTVYGYATDAGLHVYRERRRLDPAAGEVPALVIWPGQESASREYGKQVCVMELGVEAHTEIGTADPSLIKQALLADLIRLLTDPATKQQLDPDLLVSDIEYSGGGTSAPVEAGDTTVGVSANFRIKYRYKIGDPFTQ